MMGFAWGLGGLASPFVGLLADRIGIERTLTAMAAVPLLAAALAVPLPSGKRTSPHVNAGIVTPEPVRMDVAE
jgi:nitrate/nitrite transporter NarK